MTSPTTDAPRPSVEPRSLSLPWAKANIPLILLGVLGLLVAPLLIAGMAKSGYYLNLFVLFFIYAVIAQCWNLVLGVAGIFSLAQVAFFAIGGYATAMFSVKADVFPEAIAGWSPWITIWFAPVAAAAAALLLGLPMLRLRGIYVVLLTLGFQEAVRNFLATGPTVFGRGHGLAPPRLEVASLLGIERADVAYYYAALAIFLVSTFAVWRLIRSPTGVALTAMRDSPEYAESRGIDPLRLKLALFAYSAFFTGLAGGFMAHYLGAISPTTLSFPFLVLLITMIVVGGWGTFWGPILGTALVIALDEWLRGALDGGWRLIVFGLLLGVIVVAAPNGLGPWLSERRATFLRVFREAE
jgi:branched-chain amino acid transport system permease protein